jgi:midasin
MVPFVFPQCLTGPTSSGKTTMVMYLAKLTGHRCVRINNHEHTDLQEYMGSYVSDAGGKLVFKEGLLVEAVRKGYWIILDELNLAPSEVLEALNRLLDDNRELFIPETQEVVTPHPSFMIFGTQNPPGVYGGRKILSRAFRNRFLELHVDDIPNQELRQILDARCALAPSFCDVVIAVSCVFVVFFGPMYRPID